MPAEYRIALADVQVIEGREGLIGRGALGEVRRGRYAGTEVALKGLHMLRTDAEAAHAMGGALAPAERRALQADFFRECDILRRAVHPNILPFIGVVVDAAGSQPLFLAAQYIASGTLHDLLYSPRHAALRSDGGYLPLETQLVVLEGVFGALAYLAQLPLIHRDVKPPNILAVVEGGRLAKVLLADFGEAKQLTQTMTHVRGTVAGTPIYMAPEMRGEDDAKGPKADVFSAGVVAVEVSTQRQPNPGPEMQRHGGRRVFVPEEQRRAADIAAVRHPIVAEVVARTVVDDEAARADAADIHRLCLQRLQAARPAREATVQVQVQGGQRVSVPVHGATKIAELACAVLAELGGHQLLFAGRPMDPGRTVDDYNLLDGTVVHMLGLAGEAVDAATLRLEQARRADVERINAQLVAEVEAKDAQIVALRHEQSEEQQRLRREGEHLRAQLHEAQRALRERDARVVQSHVGGGYGVGGGGGGGRGGGAHWRPQEAVPPQADTQARGRCQPGSIHCSCGGGCKCKYCGKPMLTVRARLFKISSLPSPRANMTPSALFETAHDHVDEGVGLTACVLRARRWMLGMADVCRVLGLSSEYVHVFLLPELRHGARASAAGVFLGSS